MHLFLFWTSIYCTYKHYSWQQFGGRVYKLWSASKVLQCLLYLSLWGTFIDVLLLLQTPFKVERLKCDLNLATSCLEASIIVFRIKNPSETSLQILHFTLCYLQCLQKKQDFYLSEWERRACNHLSWFVNFYTTATVFCIRNKCVFVIIWLSYVSHTHRVTILFYWLCDKQQSTQGHMTELNWAFVPF